MVVVAVGVPLDQPVGHGLAPAGRAVHGQLLAHDAGQGQRALGFAHVGGVHRHDPPAQLALVGGHLAGARPHPAGQDERQRRAPGARPQLGAV
ncbi:hypothetical protein CKY47_31915 [Saccharothrix yanglingensis]|uniref:Uncharacterized protein n=1 Tax=Saccharothrix yanglingensis TaxID=659496 RepID=A0ABU0X8M2_9PSEU|nr:hypothetical protein [Saccharothrix yanglingensis]